MRRSSSRSAFTALRTEGGLLPPDFLERLAAGDKEISGLNTTDFHLEARESIGEAITRSWSRLKGSWLTFRDDFDKTGMGDPTTGLTREKWLLPLFRELGYGRLVRARAQEIDGKSFAISHSWHHSPIHLLGARLSLDKRASGVAGAAQASPHGLLQEFLNRSDDHLWGFVSNGFSLRILRDHHSLTRQAYIEFDLETIFNGEQYDEFALLWLVTHQSRIDSEKPEECWLEQWFQRSRDEGIRALDKLRDGVERAIETLGAGFLRHRANKELLAELESGELDAQEYYRELLRLVYRLIFLFAAEDRDALLDPNASDEAKARYLRFYATSRLRQLADRSRGGSHGDLWQALRLVMERLYDGCPELALPGLGSFLWQPSSTSSLSGAELQNRDLLAALRSLCTIQDGTSRYPVNWRNLGSEELGSIYEGLLELSPFLNREAATFELRTTSGHERKTTSSYYTAPPLVECLLDLALEPLLDVAVVKPNPEQAVLNLRICDPACGSGHFLVAASHRIANRLAAIRSGDDQASPPDVQKALRDVVGRCLFGVDLNPMAVELCKVSLWMEALEPGRPLSFLDTHIQCGNALLGALPELLANGIPDQAFDALEGDDKKIASTLKKANKTERAGQLTLIADLVSEPKREYDNVASRIGALDEVPDDDVAAVRRKEKTWYELRRSGEYQQVLFHANAWCASFFWPKTSIDLQHAAPTHDLWRTLLRDSSAIPARTRELIDQLSEHYRFFHWHIAFPQVFETDDAGANGFDLMLGNPPWDTLSPDTKEFFSAFDPRVRVEDRSGQKRIMDRLLERPDIAAKWATYRRDLYAGVHFIKKSGRYQLFAPGNLGKGDFNVYRMFVETALLMSRDGGLAAQLVPENIYNGANAMAIRNELFECFELHWLLGFHNAKGVWFPGIHRSTKFALYSARKGGRTTETRTAFNIRSLDELETAKKKPLRLPITLVHEFSPVAMAFMEFDSQLDIDIVAKMYSRYPNFGNEAAGPPFRHYMRELDMGNDRFRFSEAPPGLPLYEGRMVSLYDHRSKGYRSGRGRSAVWEDLSFEGLEKSIQPQWWIREENMPEKARQRAYQFRVGWCDVGSPTNVRSLVSTLLPAGCLGSDTVPNFVFDGGWEWHYLVWIAVANSFTMDFLARKKVTLHLKYFILDSLPFPRFAKDNPLARELVGLCSALVCLGAEMSPFLELLSEQVPKSISPDSSVADPEIRARIRTRIDALVARDLYGLSRSELEHVLEAFPIVRRRDEKSYGHYRTRDWILEIYDEKQSAESAHIPGQVPLS